jgi:hypothetical protein
VVAQLTLSALCNLYTCIISGLHLFLQAMGTDVPCTLLHYVDSVLKDVATGSVMQPGNRMFHGRQMPSNVLRSKWLERCGAVTMSCLPFSPREMKMKNRKPSDSALAT